MKAVCVILFVVMVKAAVKVVVQQGHSHVYIRLPQFGKQPWEDIGKFQSWAVGRLLLW